MINLLPAEGGISRQVENVNLVFLPEEIQLWLEWAGRQSLSLGGRRPGPNGHKSNWPDFPDDKHTAFGYTQERLRPPTPNSKEIELIDEIFGLIHLVKRPDWRVVLQKRSLVLPLSYKYLWTWSKLAREFHHDRRTVQEWHFKGLEEIGQKASLTFMCRLHTFLTPTFT